MKEIKQELCNILLKTSSKIPFSNGKTNGCTFLVILLKTHGISDNTVAVSTPNSKLWSLNMFSHQNKPRSLQECLLQACTENAQDKLRMS